MMESVLIPARDQRFKDLQAIEQASVRFWPAHETQAIGGWLWRYSNGGSQRANSVSTLDDPGKDLETAISTAEELYVSRSAPALFQVTEVSFPAELDAALAARGYIAKEFCTTLARPAAGENADRTISPDIEISERLTEDWFETYASVITPDRQAQARAILDRLPSPRAFFGYRRGRDLLATSLCLTLDDLARVKCIATRASARRTGAAEAVMRAAMTWAALGGARTVALGVSASNEPAQALYAKLGFALVGRYHIRAKHI